MTQSEADYELSWLTCKTNREEVLNAIAMARNCLRGYKRLVDVFEKRFNEINEEIDDLEKKTKIEGPSEESRLKAHDLGIRLNLLRQLHLDMVDAFDREEAEKEGGT